MRTRPGAAIPISVIVFAGYFVGIASVSRLQGQTIDLAVTLQAPPSPAVGIAGTFTLQIQATPTGATGVAATTIFSPAVTLNPSTGCSSISAAADPSTTVTCSWSGVNIAMSVTPRTSGILRVGAGVIGNQTDPILANNSTIRAVPVSPGSGVCAAVRGDFNADAQSDILWRHGVTGANTVWLMNGAAVSSQIPVPSVADLNWQIAGVGDFNCDGKPDILWRNRATGANLVWMMNGSTVVSQPSIPPVSDLNWKVVGVADFDLDGKPDILWRNFATGENTVWFMNGVAVASQSALPTIADQGWTVGATGDFSGDGRTDIVWRYLGTGANAGQNTIWLMNGTSVTSQVAINSVTDLNWRIVGAADFTQDGKLDLLWRNISSGDNTVWAMNGTSVLGTVPVVPIPDVNWAVVGPR